MPKGPRGEKRPGDEATRKMLGQANAQQIAQAIAIMNGVAWSAVR
jgi:hypothetical protein